eukprot:353887-Chlamydomonas_euryale.AAC.6
MPALCASAPTRMHAPHMRISPHAHACPILALAPYARSAPHGCFHMRARPHAHRPHPCAHPACMHTIPAPARMRAPMCAPAP